MKTCPYCAEQIQDAAKICRFCQRDLATGKTPTQTVIVQGPRWSEGIAALLSLLIPGAGQMYKGEVGKGFAFLICTVIGYAMLIFPGLILHVIAIVEAASGDPNSSTAPAVERSTYPEPTLEERRARQRRTVQGFAVVGGVIVAAVVIGRLAAGPERSEPKRKLPKLGGPRAATAVTSSNDATHLDATDWATKLKAIVERGGGSCPEVVSTFHNGVRDGIHAWSVKCLGGESYAVALQTGRPATLTPCALAREPGIECFKVFP